MRKSDVLFALVFAGWLLIASCMRSHDAAGAEIRLPNEIRHGRSLPDGDIGTFGTYSAAYYRSRWSRMCKGPQRYDAMREAYELQRPDPCNGAKVWVR